MTRSQAQAALLDRDEKAAGQRVLGFRYLSPLFLGAALNPINSAIIATALVSIAHALDVTVAQTSVLISSLYLTCAVAQPAAGRLAEQVGARRTFVGGLALVLVAGIIGATANDLTSLVVARVLIGAGTSTCYPSAMLLIHRRAESHGGGVTPRRALAHLSIVGSSILAVGPTFGGVLVSWFGWRAAFAVNIPCALVTLVLVLRWVTTDGRPADSALRTLAGRIDLIGMLLFSAFMTCTVVSLMALREPNWFAAAGVIVAGVGLCFWERRAANPFIDVRHLARNRTLSITYVRHALTLVGIFTVVYGFTQWMQIRLEFSAMEAGMALLPVGLGSVSGSWVTSRWPVRRLRRPLTVSATLLLLASAGTSLLSSDTPIPLVLSIGAAFGVAAGIGNAVNQLVVYRAAPVGTLGTASGLLRTFGYFGSITSAAIAGMIFHQGITDASLRHVGWALGLVAVGVFMLSTIERTVLEL